MNVVNHHDDRAFRGNLTEDAPYALQMVQATVSRAHLGQQRPKGRRSGLVKGAAKKKAGRVGRQKSRRPRDDAAKRTIGSAGTVNTRSLKQRALSAFEHRAYKLAGQIRKASAFRAMNDDRSTSTR